jgi:hypothetical protein
MPLYDWDVVEFGGIRRDVVTTKLRQEGKSYAQDMRNTVHQFFQGGLAPRPGLVRINFSSTYTPDGRIDALGVVRVAAKTRLVFLTGTGTLYRYYNPARAAFENQT